MSWGAISTVSPWTLSITGINRLMLCSRVHMGGLSPGTSGPAHPGYLIQWAVVCML